MTTQTATTADAEPANVSAKVDSARVDRNFLTYLACQVMSWAVTFVTMSVIPRSIGEANSGKVVVASVATSVPIAILAFGVDQFMTKEIGRDRGQAADLVGATLGLRLALMIPAFLGSMVIALALHAQAYDWLLISILLPSMAANFVSGSMKAAFAGLEQAKRAGVVDMLVAWAPVYSIPFLRYGPVAVVVSLAVTTISVALMQWRWTRSTLTFHVQFSVSKWKHLIRGGLPFCINNYLLSLYGLVSVFVVRHWLGDIGLGTVGQVSRLFGTFLFIPTAMVSAMLPALARMAENDPTGFDRAKSRVLAVLLVFGLPVTAIAIVLAHPLSHLLYSRSKFVDVPLALQTIAFAILPMYVVSTMYQFLVAQGRAHVWSRYLLLTVVIYGAVAFVATPLCLRVFHNGPMGAAVATVVSETMGAAVSIALLRVSLFTREFAGRTLRAMAATLLMAAAMLETLELVSRMSLRTEWAVAALQVIVPACVGVAVFAIATLYLRVLYPQDQQRIGELFSHVTNRLRRVARV